MSSISLTDRIQEITEQISPNYEKSVDVDAGWYQLVVDCYDKLCEIDPYHTIFQIKQKCGNLRYYFSTTLEGDALGEMSRIVSHYEDIASKTCELTGKPGILMQKGFFYKTLCENFLAEGWKPVRKSK